MNRKDFIRYVSLATFSTMMDLKTFGKMVPNKPSAKMPVLFIGHGSPMNGIQDNPFTKSLNRLGKEIPAPRAILVVSAHWLTRGTYVLNSPRPRIIYDFGGFPEELYQVKYDAPGSPEFAARAKEAVHSAEVGMDESWGLDHGAWTILKHLYPKADIPVFQMSIDFSKPPAYHYKLASELKTLRSQGVLIIGSGNIVHNLGMISWRNPLERYDWSVEFDEKVKLYLNRKQHKELVEYEKMGEAARLSVPTNDHYLPMIYAIGLQDQGDELVHTYESVEMGSVSMRCFRIG